MNQKCCCTHILIVMFICLEFPAAYHLEKSQMRHVVRLINIHGSQAFLNIRYLISYGMLFTQQIRNFSKTKSPKLTDCQLRANLLVRVTT